MMIVVEMLKTRESIVVYLKWPRRRREKKMKKNDRIYKKQVDLMLKRSKLEKGARNEAALIKSLKKKGHPSLRWRCGGRFGYFSRNVVV